MEKEILKQKIRDNVVAIMESQHISQIELHRRCVEQGYQISQPELSKALSGKTSFTIFHLTAFSEVFNISLDQLVSGEKTKRVIFIDGGKFFVTDPSDEAYKGYMGTFYTVLQSTSPFENKLLHGTLTFQVFEAADPICEAVFELNTGVQDTSGKEIKKYYQGQLILSRRLDTAYCILLNETIGELVLIEFRHRDFFVREVECRIGLILSTSSGEEKLPVVQRVILTRSRIEEKHLLSFIPYLRLIENGEVFITQSHLKQLQNEYQDFRINSDQKEVYCLLDEQSVRGIDRSVARSELAEIVGKIRELAAAPWISKITEREDSFVYSLEQKLKDE